MKLNLRLPQISSFLLAFCISISSIAQQFAIIGDAGKAGSDLDRLKASIMKENVSSLILPGDNLYSGTYESVWDGWKKSGLNFDVVAIGNHNDSYETEMAYFNMPAEMYSVVKNGARFIVLNSDNESSVTEQISWLKQELAAATESLVFLVYHHPTFSVGSHQWTDRRKFQKQMREILKQNGSKITALILGHDHLSEFLNFGSIPVIVGGSGREARNEEAVSYIEDGVKVETKYLAPAVPHWGLMEVLPGAQEALVHFVRVSDQKRVCSARFRNREMTLEGDCH